MDPIKASPFVPAGRKTLAAMGDSLTFNANSGVAPVNYYAERVAVALRALGVSIQARNFGMSGQTSANMLARLNVLTQFDIPALGIIYSGFNDFSNGLTQAQTQANIQAITEAYFNAGTSFVVILSRHYCNWDTGTVGDDNNFGPPKTPKAAVPHESGTICLWQACSDAAAAELALHPGRVVFCDLYAYFYNLLVANPTWCGVASVWHCTSPNPNVHWNVAGCQYAADAIMAAINAQEAANGWITQLKAW